MLRTTLLLLALLFANLPAYAFEDRVTGLGVDLPPEFVVSPIRPLGEFEAAIGINYSSGKTFAARTPNLCEVTFDRQPGWIAFEQARFNRKLSQRSYPINYARQIASLFTVLRSERFEIRGIVAQEFITTPNNNPSVVAVISAMETSAGKTTLTCVTARRYLLEAAPVFRTILSAVTPPPGRRR